MSTHRVTAYMTQIQMAEWEFPDEVRMLMATPLSHAAAAFFIPVLQKGGAFYVMQGFSPDEFFDMVEQHRITCTMLVPVMLYYLMDSPRAATADMSSMETIFYGASAMSPARLRQGIEKWGQVFYQFFGQSEAPMVIANLRRADHDLEKPQRLSSCGRPSPWVHIALLDPQGKPVANGEPGEICVRGPLVMKGYKDMPEQTAEAFAGDWLHTGDVGKLDEEGFLYIVDRTKDMIVTGGFNVFPREVEDVLATHEAVGQVAVIGVPDEHWGEAVKAVVVLRPGSAAGAGTGAGITGPGQAGEGFGAGTQVRRLRRRHSHHPGWQTRQKSPAGTLLGGQRERRRLRPCQLRASQPVSSRHRSPPGIPGHPGAGSAGGSHPPG